jgi:hypothetical protein
MPNFSRICRFCLFAGYAVFAGCGQEKTAIPDAGGDADAGMPECVTDLHCYDENICTDDFCQEGICVHLNNHAACDDGQACSTNDHCLNGVCVGESQLSCDDGNPCTTDGCDDLAGCVHYPNSLPCSDDDECTRGDVCSEGRCQPGAEVDCDDSNICTDESCDPLRGCVYVNNQNPCDDGQLCSTNDRCVNGVCVGESDKDCDDGNPCTEDSCDDALGCVHSYNRAPCDDNNECTLYDVCNLGVCAGVEELDCEDGNVCTTDKCFPDSGCDHAYNSDPCDDSNACTLGDLCDQGACQAGAESLDCDDGNPCTDDACDPSLGCIHSQNSESCDDRNNCTTDDTCIRGSCLGSALDEDADGHIPDLCGGDDCDDTDPDVHPHAQEGGAGTATCTDGIDNDCDGLTDADDYACFNCAVDGDCDDGNPCTQDHCNPGYGCVFYFVTTTCDDSDPCSHPDVCQAGSCIAGPNVCGDSVVIMVYLDADNNLDPFGVEDLEEMEAAGVDDVDWLRVFVLMDRWEWASWADSRLYEVHNGYSQELGGAALGLTVEAEEELNMGDPATLTGFVQDVKALAGEDASYYLILWDHGEGWRRRAGFKPANKGVCIDETDGEDWLYTAEIHTALEGQGLDLIGFDACLEGMAEVAYQIRTDAQVMVASEETEPGAGWDYYNFLRRFADEPSPTPRRFAQLVIDTYMISAAYEDMTLSAYDLSRMDALAQAADAMAGELMLVDLQTWNAIINDAEWFGCFWGYCEPYADLYHVAESARSHTGENPEIYEAVMSVVLNEVVVYERHRSDHPDAHGISVYLPWDGMVDPDYNSTRLMWAEDTHWEEMLER